MIKPAFYRVLVAMEPGKEFSVDEIAEELRVTASTVKRYLREIAKLGYVVDLDGKYMLSEKGELFRKSLVNLMEKKIEPSFGYVFTDPSTSSPVPVRVCSLEQLYIVAKYDLVPREILEHHLRAGYITSWVKEVLGDIDLAEKLSKEKDLNVDRFTELIEERIKILESVRGIRRG